LAPLNGFAPAPHRRDDTTFRAFGVAHLDKASEPTLERRQVRVGVGQRTHAETRRLAGTIARHRGQPMHQGAGTLRPMQMGQQILETDVHGQPLSPAGHAIGRAELQARLERPRAAAVFVH
jgi:hypothetical protein